MNRDGTEAAIYLFVAVLVTVPLATMPAVTYANDFTDKQEFDAIVNQIFHKDIIVTVTINGVTHKQVINGLPSSVPGPASQIVVFLFSRKIVEPPSTRTIRLGDLSTMCIKLRDDSEGSCINAPVDSLTQPIRRIFDARYIPD